MISVSESLMTDQLMSKEKVRNTVLTALKKGKFSPVGAFGIFLPQNPENLYEIIALNELRKPPYKDGHYHMIALCGSKSEAIMMIAKLWMKEGGRR